MIVELGGCCFKILVVFVNMVIVINDEIVKWFVINDYFYIMYCFVFEICCVFIEMMYVV